MALTTQTITSTYDFSGSGQSGLNFQWSLDDDLYVSKTDSTRVNIFGSHYVTASYSFGAGIKGSLNVSLGSYSYDYPVTVSATLPRDVGLGEIFTVDPQLVSVNDASFSMTGPTATASLFFGAQASFGLTFNKGASVGPSLPLTVSLDKLGTNIPPSHTFDIPDVPGASITVAQPQPFSASAQQVSQTGALPSLTVSGSGNDVISASLDFVALLVGVFGDEIPPLKALQGSYDFSPFFSLEYALASLPLTAGLALGQTLTLTPQEIDETLVEKIAGVTVNTFHGKLGDSFQITSPTTGIGEIDIYASYTAKFQLETATGIVGDISLSLNGPSMSGTLLGFNFDVGPLGSFTFFDDATGLGTIDDHLSSVDDSATDLNPTYRITYGVAKEVGGTETLTVTPTTTFAAGALLLDDGAKISFQQNNAAPGAMTIVNNLALKGTATLTDIGDSLPVTLAGDVAASAAGFSFLYLKGDANTKYRATGKLLTRFVELVNGSLDLVSNYDSGMLTLDAGTKLNLGADAYLGTLNGAGTLNFDSLDDGVTLTVGGANLSGGFTGDFVEAHKALNVRKIGSADLFLTSASLYTGSTEIDNGSMTLTGAANVLSGDFTINAPGLLDLRTSLVIGSLSGDGSVKFDSGGASELAIGVSNKSTTFAGQITTATGTGKLVLIGTGMLTLTGANSWSNGTKINAGATLRLARAGSLAGNITDNGALIFKQRGNPAFGGQISGTGKVTIDGEVILSAINSFTGGLTLTEDSQLKLGNFRSAGIGSITLNNHSVLVTPGPTATLSNTFLLGGQSGVSVGTGGVVTLAGQLLDKAGASGGFTKVGLGQLVVKGAAKFTGAVEVDNGALALAGLQTSFAQYFLVNAPGLLVLDHNVSLGALAGSGNVQFNGAPPDGTSPITLTVGASGKSTTFSGALVENGSVGTLVKVGTGTLTLSGANAYTGGTQVNAGTLIVTNAATGASVGVLGPGPVSVAAGATLQFKNHEAVQDGYIVSTQPISGAGNLVFTGSDDSITTLNTDNPGFTGKVTIQSGIVHAFGNIFGTAAVTMTGGALGATAAPLTLSNALTISGQVGFGAATDLAGGVTLAGDANVYAAESAGDRTWSGKLALAGHVLTTQNGGPSAAGATWDNQTLLISGVISGGGGLNQASVGTLSLTGVNTYSGSTFVSQGTLKISNKSALGTSTVLFSGTAVLEADFNGSLANALYGYAGASGTINAGPGNTVTLTGAMTQEAGSSLTLGAGVVFLANGAGVSTFAGTLAGAGALSLVGSSTTFNSATLTVSRWSMSGAAAAAVNGTLAYAGPFAATGTSTVTVNSGGNLSLSGAVTLSANVAGAGTLTIAGGATALAGAANLTVANWSLTNEARVTVGANVTYGGALSVGAAAMATLLANVKLTLTGTGSTISGSIAGAGTLAQAGGGSATFASGAKLTVAKWSLADANTTANVNGALAYAGALTEGAGAKIAIANGASLTLTKTNTLDGAVTGLGALSIAGGATTVDGTAALSVARVLVSGATTSLVINGAPSALSGTLLVGAGAKTTVNSGGTLTLSGAANVSGNIGGAGALAVSGGSASFATGSTLSTANLSLVNGRATFNGFLTYNGAVSEDSLSTITTNGVLTLAGGGTLGGAVNGAGGVILQSGAFTISGAAAFSEKVLNLNLGATATLAKSLSFAGNMTVANNSTLTLSGSSALTLSGSTNFLFGAVVNGSGSLTINGGAAASMGVKGLTVGGTVFLRNFKTITEAGGALTIGDAGAGAAALVNASGAVFNLTDNFGVKRGASASSLISNAGLFEKTGGTGVSLVAPKVVNTGQILAASGTLELSASVSGAGSMTVKNGAILKLDGTVAASQLLGFDATGGEYYLNDLAVGGAQLFHGVIQGWAAGDLIGVGSVFGPNVSYAFTEDAGNATGTLSLSGNGASASIAFGGLGGAVLTTANFVTTLDGSGGTVFGFHA